MGGKLEKEIYDVLIDYFDNLFVKRDFEQVMASFGQHIRGFGSSKDETMYDFETVYTLHQRDIHQANNPVRYEVDHIVIETPKDDIGLITCELSIETYIHDQKLRFNHVRYTIAMVKKDKQWLIEQKHLSLPTIENEDDEAYPVKQLEARNEALKRLVEDKTNELKTALDEITKLANTDVLSGLANRSSIDRTLGALIDEAKTQNQPLSVVMVDVDNFKQINDTYGHLTGDKIIRGISELLEKHLPSSAFVGRWGGDEFVLFYPKESIKKTYIKVEKLRDLIAKTSFDKVKTVTASFGISEYRERDTIETIIARSDKALYKAKDAGKNCVYPQA